MVKGFSRRCAWLCFLGCVAFFTIGAVGAKANFSAVKEAPSREEWVAFYEAHPEFVATDCTCSALKELADKKGLDLKEAYLSTLEKSEWMSFLEKYPEFPATDSNCARLEEKAMELEEGLEYAYAELYLL